MVLPESLRLARVKQPGTILYFVNRGLQFTEEPHYHVVLGYFRGEVHVVACSSKVQKRMDYVTRAGLAFETLVVVKASNENGLRTESCIDCNSTWSMEPLTLLRSIEEHAWSRIATLEPAYMEQIWKGVSMSDTIEGWLQDEARAAIIRGRN